MLTDYKVLTFDCYGTLIDWESGIWDALQPLIHASGRTDITRDTALLAYAADETAQEIAAPATLYPELLRLVHRAIAERFGLDTSDEMDEAFAASVPHWPAFADTADTLRRLARHFDLVILSNIDCTSFATAKQRLGVTFDAIYTAEDVGSYKPSPANFTYMLEHLEADLGHQHADILHTAQSIHHDHRPAKDFGLANAWIDRQRLSQGGSWGATSKIENMPAIDHLFFTLAEMADAVEAEAASAD